MKISELEGKLKVGDKVLTNGNGKDKIEDIEFEGEVGEINNEQFYVWQNTKEGDRGCISPETKGYLYSWVINFKNPGKIKIINSSNQINMNLAEKFVLALTPEPQKTFRKVGITNGDDLLTDEGQKVFLSWLLKKNQEEFKKEVADGLLADLEEKK